MSSVSGTNQWAVSVVISARNEESNIQTVLKAICNQNYNTEKLEIILVDDGSSDNTYMTAKQFSERHTFIKVIKSDNKPYPGKKGALSLGIAEASNQYILITDADCIPESEWVKSFTSRFSEGYDLLFGIAPFYQNDGFVNRIACFDELRGSLLSFGLANMGYPYSAAARSFGFTKPAYEKIGGYRNTTETLSGDDDLLIREAVKNDLKIGTVTSVNSKVYSEAKTTLREYILQKARHTSTSNYYLFKHQVILAIWHLVNLVFLFSPVISGLSKLFLIPFFLKLGVDWILVNKFQKRFGYTFGRIERIYLQIIYELLLIVNYLLSFFRKNKW